MNVTNSSLLAGRVIEGAVSARMRIDGRPYVNFFGHGYLALSEVPEIRDAAMRALTQGVPFARQLPAAIGGIEPIFAVAEQAGALACGTEASVYFASGYLIGSIGLKTFTDSIDLILMDELAHFNLRDAAALTGLPTHVFRHCDVDSVKDLLSKHIRPGQRPVLLTDGVFATSGRLPPLAEYAKVLSPYEGRLFIDEAHSFGVVGELGHGAAEFCGVENIAATGATLSKAFCAQGALVGCSGEAAIRVQREPPIRGACAGSPLSAAAAAASLTYVRQCPELRSSLREMTDYFRKRVRSIGLDVIDSPAPIVSFRCGTRDDMQALQRRLFERGIHVYHSSYIGAGTEGMIRCAVFRDHCRGDIDHLIDALSH